MTNPDPVFSDPHLAKIYDDFDPDRSDLLPYLNMIAELNAHHVTDLGCGTGSFALLLNKEGVTVTGIDPASASIGVAQSKPGADEVTWVVGGANVLAPNSTDAVVMTGNVAQAIVDPTQWSETLDSIHHALKPGGRLIFETRDIKYQAWNHWNKEESSKSVATRTSGEVEGYVELLDVSMPLVSFRWTYYFHRDNTTLTSDSTLRFRTISELQKDLTNHGFTIESMRDAPDRPGQEHVIAARVTS